MSYKLIKTTPEGGISDQIAYSKEYAALLLKYKLRLVGIRYSDEKVSDLNEIIDADVILHSQNDDAAGKRIIANLLVFDGMFRHNAVFVEDKINDDNDPDLANVLNLVFQKPKGIKSKAAIKGKNTPTKGVLEIEVTRIRMGVEKPKFAHHYDLYGAIVTEGGTGLDEKVGQLFKTKGLVGGFISGDKYSIYAIPFDINGNAGEPTPAFIIRVN